MRKRLKLREIMVVDVLFCWINVVASRLLTGAIEELYICDRPNFIGLKDTYKSTPSQ